MRKIFPVEDLAAMAGSTGCTWPSGSPTAATPPSRAAGGAGRAALTPSRPDAPDAARQLMHGIFVGEIQALEGAGRTCWDFPVPPRPPEESPTPCPSSSSSTWPSSAGTRPATARSL